MVRNTRNIAVISSAALVFGMIAASASSAQTAPPPDGYAACHFYSINSCSPPQWQDQGYSSIQACKNAYFNHCYYGDPLPGDPDAAFTPRKPLFKPAVTA